MLADCLAGDRCRRFSRALPRPRTALPAWTVCASSC